MNKRIVLTVCAGIFFPAVLLQAADPPFHDKPATTRSLPADNLPPFQMLNDQGQLMPFPAMPPGGPHRGAGAAPESMARGPILSVALEAAQEALRSCQTAGYQVGVAVIDSAGEARALLTADGSDGSHVFVAMRKALTALAFQTPSSEAKVAIDKDKTLLAKVTPAMFVMGGALPILSNGEVIGAIGVSGAAGMPMGHQDEICAQTGLRKIAVALSRAGTPNPAPTVR